MIVMMGMVPVSQLNRLKSPGGRFACHADSLAYQGIDTGHTPIFDREMCPLKHWSISVPGLRCRS